MCSLGRAKESQEGRAGLWNVIKLLKDSKMKGKCLALLRTNWGPFALDSVGVVSTRSVQCEGVGATRDRQGTCLGRWRRAADVAQWVERLLQTCADRCVQSPAPHTFMSVDAGRID